MNREFIPYELALELKQLGFKERCFGHYWENLFYFKTTFHHPSTMPNSPESCLAPTYSQAFRWFRDKYDLYCYVEPYKDNQFDYVVVSDLFGQEDCDGELLNTYEEAELACLRKLIEIAKTK
jgi:hypothetical protein